MSLSVLKIYSPKAEVFFVEDRPLERRKIKTPRKGHLLGRDTIKNEDISLPLQALRVLGYPDHEFPHGFLIASTVTERISLLFGGERIKDPLDEVDERVFSDVEGLLKEDLVLKRIERVRFELFPVTFQLFDLMKKMVHNAK